MTELKVEGMSCKHCCAKVEKVVKDVKGVKKVSVDLESGMVSIKGDFDLDKVKNAITEEGYKVI